MRPGRPSAVQGTFPLRRHNVVMSTPAPSLPLLDAAAGLAADPMPQPPPEPDFDACCGNGCDPCIFDLHDLEMDRYRQALRAWRERHPDATPPRP